MPYIGQQTVQVASVNAATPEAVNHGLTALANSLNTILGALQSGRLTVGGAKFDSQRVVVPSTGPGPLDPNVLAVTAAGVTTWYVWDGSAWQALATESYVIRMSGTTGNSTAAPAPTASIVGVMMGLALAYTPTIATKALVTITGAWANSVLADGVQMQIRYGTGTAPVNGAALTGTAIGSLMTFNKSAVATDMTAFTLCFPITGLSIGTTYWIDMSLGCITGGTASVTTVDAVALETT